MITASDAFSGARTHLKIRAGPCGIHMFNRTTGLNVLLDEVRVPPALWAGAPRQVSIALTNACDLTCSYCFAPKNPAVLEFERAAGWLYELDVNGCLGIGFGGGEPTLYQPLAELCKYATRHTRLAVTLTTHGHRLNDELLAALAGSVHFVRVSMDGVGATYEGLRGRPFMEFRRRLESIRPIAPFGINYVVNSRTLPDLDAAVKLAADLGALSFCCFLSSLSVVMVALMIRRPRLYNIGCPDTTVASRSLLARWDLTVCQHAIRYLMKVAFVPTHILTRRVPSSDLRSTRTGWLSAHMA